MTNAELIAKIKVEIKRLIEESDFDESANLYSLLSFLDTLESETTYDTQQYTPRPSVDIGDVARVQFASHVKVFDKKRKAVFDWEQFKEVASIFYGFGKKDSSSTLESEKPIDIDFEQELYKHFGQVKDFTLGMRIGKYFYELGKQSGSSKIQNDLEEAARRYGFEEYMRRCNGGEYGTSEDAFIAGAKWQKEQMLKEAVEGRVISNDGISFPVSNEIHRLKLIEGDKVRIIIVE